MSSWRDLHESLQVAIASRLKKQNRSSLAQTSASGRVAASGAQYIRARKVAAAASALRANARIAKIQAGRSLVRRVAAAIVQSMQARYASVSQLRRAGFEIDHHPKEFFARKTRSVDGAEIEILIWQEVPLVDDVTSNVTVELPGQHTIGFSGEEFRGKKVVIAEAAADIKSLTPITSFLAAVQELLRAEGLPLLVRVGRYHREFGSATTWEPNRRA